MTRRARSRRATRVAAGSLGALALGAATLLVPAAPASATGTVGVAFAAGTLTLTLTGDVTTRVQCDALSNVYVQGAAATSTPCNQVVKIVATGDGGGQSLNLAGFTTAQFPALTNTNVNLGAGNDTFFTSPVKDVVDLGAGADQLVTTIDSNTDSVTLGGDSPYDTAQVSLTAPDHLVVTAAGTLTKVAGNAGAFAKVTGAKRLYLYGSDGADTIDGSHIPAGADLTLLVYAGAGDDTIIGSPNADVLGGDDGNDTISGGAGGDTIEGGAGVDTLDGGSGADGYQIGQVGLGPQFPQIGDIITDPSTPNSWLASLLQGDNAIRIRQDATTHAFTIVSGISHIGKQVLPPQVPYFTLSVAQDSSRPIDDRSVIDTVLGPGNQYLIGDTTDLVDITAATAGWTRADDAGGSTFDQGPGTHIRVDGPTGALIHLPWADAQESFAHRITRDLLFRFPSASDRTTLAAQLRAGTKTYAGVAGAIVNTDEWRGIEVDRAYNQYLRRKPDAGGRAYWVGRVASGTSIRALRSLLLGSPEYFSTFGYSSNEQWVRSAYNDVLGRAPEAGGLAYWVDRLNAGGARSTAADAFLATLEARTTIVRAAFLRFNDREPTAGELSSWTATLLNSGTGEQTLVSTLASSATYVTRG